MPWRAERSHSQFAGSREGRVRFGFFDQLPCAEGYSERQRYQDIMAPIELGDTLGFHTVWLGDLHFSRPFSILATPLMVLAAAAQRTKRIRLGTAVTLLPLHNPVKIAEEAATADILSDGRLEFGVGQGTAPLHYAMKQSLPPTIQRWLLLPFWPIGAGLRPSRLGWINSIPVHPYPALEDVRLKAK